MKKKKKKKKVDLLCATLHHLSEQRDAVQVDELLGEGDVPRRVGQILQGLQFGIHAGRLDPFMQLDRSLVLNQEEEEEEHELTSLGKKPPHAHIVCIKLTGEVVRRRMEPFLMSLRFCGGLPR